MPVGAEAMDEPSPRSRHGSCASGATAQPAGAERTGSLSRPILTGGTCYSAIIKRMRHDACGGRAGKVELLTGIEGVTSRPVRRIVLME